MYIVLIDYKAAPEQIAAARPAHREHLGIYYEKGWLIASGPQTSPDGPPRGGVLIAVAPSRQALDEMNAADPFVVEGLAEYRVIEFTPAKYAAALEPFVNPA